MKILVLGDGLLGSEIVKQTNWDYISRKKDLIDVREFSLWSGLLDPYDIIINCIAYTNTYGKNKEESWESNVRFVDSLSKFCSSQDKKLVHVSTDYIYAGSVTEASENDVPVHIPTWYGYTKLVGDAIVQLNCDNYLICRLSHKPYPFPYDKAWTNIKTNCDYTNVISEMIVELIQSGATGVYNIGTENKSIFDLAKKTRDIIPIEKPDHVPSDVSMNLQKFNSFRENIDRKDDQYYLSLVIPVYKNVQNFLNNLDITLSHSKRIKQIILYSNGSSAEDNRLLRSYAEKNNIIELYTINKPIGFPKAVNEAFKKAKYENILCISTDVCLYGEWENMLIHYLDSEKNGLIGPCKVKDFILGC